MHQIFGFDSRFRPEGGKESTFGAAPRGWSAVPSFPKYMEYSKLWYPELSYPFGPNGNRLLVEDHLGLFLFKDGQGLQIVISLCLIFWFYKRVNARGFALPRASSP